MLIFSHYLDAWMHLVRIGKDKEILPFPGIDSFLKPCWKVPAR